MRHPLTLAAALAAAIAVPAMFNAAQAQTTIKIAYALAPNSHYGVAANSFDKNLQTLAPGRFKIEQFPSSALGGERETIESLQLGNLEMVVTSSGPVINFVPEAGIMDIPFLFRDSAHARAVLDGQPGQEILEKFPAKGLVALAWGEQGFRHLTNSKHAVNTPGDMKGLKLRTMENPVHMLAFRTLGASPTPMAWPEVIQGLQQGTIDGQENPISILVASKMWETQKHVTLTRHVFTPISFTMSPAFFNKRTPQEQEMIRQAARVGRDANRKYVEEADASGVTEMKKQGMAVVEQVDSEAFRARLAPVYAQYNDRFGPMMKRIAAEK